MASDNKLWYAASAAVALGALWLGLRPATVMVGASAPEPEPAPRPVEDVRSPLAEVRAVPPPVPSIPPASTPPEAKPTDDEREIFKTDVVSVEARLQRAAEREELSSRFEAEPHDAAWSAELQKKMTQLLAADGMSARALGKVDCRQTICRLNLTSASERNRDVMAMIHAARELHEETWLLPEEDEGRATYSTEVYLPRDGYRLSGGGGRIDEAPRTAAADFPAEPDH
jgi:hypothetical protein